MMHIVIYLLVLVSIAQGLSVLPTQYYMPPGNKYCTLYDGTRVTPSWVGQDRLDIATGMGNYCNECYCDGQTGKLICSDRKCAQCVLPTCPFTCAQDEVCKVVYKGCKDGKCPCPTRTCVKKPNTLVAPSPFPEGCNSKCKNGCSKGEVCAPVWNDPSCKPGDENCCPEPQCQDPCPNTCENTACDDGLFCEMQPIYCITTPCCPIPRCVADCADPCPGTCHSIGMGCKAVYPLSCMGGKCCPEAECVITGCPMESEFPCFHPPHGCNPVSRPFSRRLAADESADDGGIPFDESEEKCNKCPGVSCPDLEKRLSYGPKRRDCKNPCSRQEFPCPYNEMCIPHKLRCKLRKKICCYTPICERLSIIPGGGRCESFPWSACTRKNGCKKVFKYTYCGDKKKFCMDL